MNSSKTKIMVVREPRAPCAYSQDAYNNRYAKSEIEKILQAHESRLVQYSYLFEV